MEQILTDADNDVDAVFAANDGLATQALNALEAAGVGRVPRQRPGRDRGRHPEHRAWPADDDRLQADPGRGRRGRGGRARALRRRRHHRHRIRVRVLRRSGSQAADGKPADTAEGEGIVPYFALTPIRVTDRQHHGHRDRRRVPDDRGDLHRRHRRDGVLPGERLIRPRGSGGGASGRPLLSPTWDDAPWLSTAAARVPRRLEGVRRGAGALPGRLRGSPRRGHGSRRRQRRRQVDADQGHRRDLPVRRGRGASSRAARRTSTGRATRRSSASRSSTRISRSRTTSTSSPTCSSAASGSAPESCSTSRAWSARRGRRSTASP